MAPNIPDELPAEEALVIPQTSRRDENGHLLFRQVSTSTESSRGEILIEESSNFSDVENVETLSGNRETKVTQGDVTSGALIDSLNTGIDSNAEDFTLAPTVSHQKQGFLDMDGSYAIPRKRSPVNKEVTLPPQVQQGKKRPPRRKTTDEPSPTADFHQTGLASSSGLFYIPGHAPEEPADLDSLYHHDRSLTDLELNGRKIATVSKGHQLSHEGRQSPQSHQKMKGYISRHICFPFSVRAVH